MPRDSVTSVLDIRFYSSSPLSHSLTLLSRRRGGRNSGEQGSLRDALVKWGIHSTQGAPGSCRGRGHPGIAAEAWDNNQHFSVTERATQVPGWLGLPSACEPRAISPQFSKCRSTNRPSQLGIKYEYGNYFQRSLSLQWLREGASGCSTGLIGWLV